MTAPLFDLYFKYVEHTEPPIVFHRWSLLTGLGAFLGRQYKMEFGEFYIHPTMYTMLMGDPGTRKSTAIKLAKRVFAQAGYETFAAERTSKEKFLLDLEGIEGDDGVVKNTSAVMRNLFGDENVNCDPKEVFICADEFNEFVGSSNLEFLSLLGSLWDWDDDSKPFQQRLKTSRSVSIFQPTVSILAGNTHSGFAEAFPPQAIGQGFLSRLLLIHGEASGKKIAFPTRPSDELKSQMVELLGKIRHQVHGIATRSKQAQDMLTVIYNTYRGMEDARFKHYSTRRFTHLLKLCLLSAAAHVRTEIRAEDVLFANTLLTFTEHRMPQAMGEFGKARNSDVAAKIVSILSEATAPMEHTEIWRQVQSDLDKIEDLNKLLAGMAQGDKIMYLGKDKSPGATGFVITRKLLSNKHVYVDFSLLKEAS